MELLFDSFFIYYYLNAKNQDKFAENKCMRALKSARREYNYSWDNQSESNPQLVDGFIQKHVHQSEINICTQ